MHNNLRYWVTSEESSLLKSKNEMFLLTPQNSANYLGGGGWRAGKQTQPRKIHRRSLPFGGLLTPASAPPHSPCSSLADLPDAAPTCQAHSAGPALNRNHTRQCTEGTEHGASVTKT